MDPKNAISVTRNIFWVGFDEPNTALQCNPYLLVDRGCAILIDPGSLPEFPLMMRKVIDVIDPHTIELVVVGHQDPDVAGSLAVLEDVIGRDDLKVACQRETMRLIQHLGYRSESYVVDDHLFRYRSSSGDVLEFIPTPYAHSPGAMATYHPASRSLFSSDLFGAIGRRESIFDLEGFPESMDSFHRAYMPSNEVLRAALRRLETRDVDRILPQHGSIIEGGAIARAFEHLRGLACGIDLQVEVGSDA